MPKVRSHRNLFIPTKSLNIEQKTVRGSMYQAHLAQYNQDTDIIIEGTIIDGLTFSIRGFINRFFHI